jgi:hypothetical protein
MPYPVYAGRPSDGVSLEIFLWDRRRQRVNVKEEEKLIGLVSCLHDGTPNVHRVCGGHYKTRKLRIELRHVV